MGSGKAFGCSSTAPLFLRSCHLNFHSKFNMWLQSKKSVMARRGDILQFVKSIWETDPGMFERVWQPVANTVIRRLHPGFMFQKVTCRSYHNEYNMLRVFKVKTLVTWGKVYLGMLGR